MKCPHCKKSLWFVVDLCPFCKTAITEVGLKQLEASEKSRVEQVPASSIKSVSKGFGGWLALFALTRIFVDPVEVGLIIRDCAERYNNLTPAFWIGMISLFAVAAFGVYLGIRLWGIKPNAVRMAKYYLVGGILLKANALAFLAFDKITSPQLGVAVIYLLPFTVIWYTYFSVSKRVQLTFPVKENSANESKPDVKQTKVPRLLKHYGYIYVIASVIGFPTSLIMVATENKIGILILITSGVLTAIGYGLIHGNGKALLSLVLVFGITMSIGVGICHSDSGISYNLVVALVLITLLALPPIVYGVIKRRELS